MRIAPAALAVTVLLVASPAATAHAVGLDLGANLGFTYYSPDQGDGLSSFGWPNQGGLSGLWQPGLRIGIPLDDARRGEIVIDTGLSSLSSNGESITGFQFSGNYQYAFGAEATAPFVTAGAGVLHLGGLGDDITTAVLGAGLGLRHQLASGHGALRGELRLDHVFESENNGFVVLPATNSFGIRLGFDLFLQ